MSDIPVQDRWAAKLCTDMAHVRTRAVGLALAKSPQLAQDLADYALIRSVLEDYPSYNTGNTISAQVASRGPSEPTGSLLTLEDGFEALRCTLALGWLEADAEAAFEEFRALGAIERDQLRAFAVAQTLKPTLLANQRDAVRAIAEREVLPNLRDLWTPDEVFLSRLTKPALLAIMKDDLDMRAQAEIYAKSKKSDLVSYMGKLFAAPLPTLTDAQRVRVETWCPSTMSRAVQAPVGGGTADGAEHGGETLCDAA